MNDPRKEYVVQCIISVLNIPRSEFRSNTTSNTALEKFLDHPNEKVLQAVENDSSDTSKRTVTLQLGFSSYAEGIPEMHFIKTSYEPLTETNISRLVLISSLRMSPVRSLFYNVREVFMPLLVQSGKDSDLEGRLTDCLTELDAGLNASLRRGLRNRNVGDFEDHDVSGIVTPVDEVRFWEELKNATGVSDSAVDRATKFSDALSPIASELDEMSKKTFAQLLEFMENVMESIDSLWQSEASPAYPPARMLHFLKILSGSFGRCVQSRLNSLNVWTSSFSQVSKHIREGHKVCERWNEITVDLTDVQWRSSENIWEGEAFKDDFLTHLALRIQEVSQLRGQHDQILKLLSTEELRDMQVESCFEPFMKLSAFSYNEYTVPAWRAALADYEARMSPIEARVAERLRAELFTNTSNPAQTVRVFQRYQDLLERKNIRQSLTNERERLLTELDDFLGRVQSELETFEVNNLPAGRGLSLPARKMVWVEHFRSKADLAARPLAGFLKDLPSAGKVGNTYRKVRAELKEYRNKAFKDWCEEVDSQLRDPNDPIALEMNSRVMDFDTAQQGALKITYSERLIELVKDARLFEQLGCSIPKEVKMAVQDGMKFYRFAVQLKQVCNFYNTLSAELLPSQKLMVLQPALAFEQLFNDKSGMKKVQWNKLDQLEAFTRHVKDGAERLREVNRKLRNGHSQVSQEVLQLANISLLRQRDQWKQKISGIQKHIDATIGAVGCQVADAKPWKSHWDYQIFKIMEIQYRFGLESLNENLPEMKADLIVAQKQLKLKPPLEELKAIYFKEIKTFIALPLQFKGLDGAPHVYKVMPERNAEAIAVVFQKADELFVKVQQLQNSFAPWLVVGLLPERVQELVDELSDPKDWDMNFKAIKAKRKEMDKIPDTVKIDCFTISTVILKSVIEDHLDRLSDALIIALKRRASDEAKAVIQFLDEGLEKLNIRPDTVQELGKAQEDAKQLMEQHHEVKKQLDAADEKNKLLKSYAAGIDMNEVQNKWDDFLIRLEAFEQLAHDLREELKGKMDQRILAMNSDIEKFASRWQSLKPKSMDSFSMEDAKRNAQQMQEWQTEWQGLKDSFAVANTQMLQMLKEQIVLLQADCADFGLAPPELYQIAEVEDDLNKQQASWSLVEEFNQQYEELLAQTWLELRPRLFVVQDLAHNWMAKLREVPRDQVTHMLSQEVQRLEAAHPALKAMTGEPFERDHWKILFGLIKLPPDLRLEELRFKDLAQRLNVIVDKVDELKELTARAIGEVTIRDAVMEVSAWFEQAEFNLMDHQVKGGFVPLIKDWKDLMSEVSEKQSLCGSLKDSRFFGPFKDQVDKFEEKLALLDELLLCMNKVQRKWVYLEPIFGRGSLPREKERFDKVNNQYRQIMKNVGSQKKVNYLCTVRGLKDQFTNMLDQLERCQKALNSFLEEKRSAFPRLYFIGDEDLLEILGQSSNPEVIQAHLKKLFAGIATVDFDPNITRIVAMNSSLKENVPLGNPVVVKEGEEPLPVEEWLSNLSNEMFSTLAAQLQGCYAQSEMDMQQFERYPSQLLCLSANIHFTFNVERYMSNGQLLQLKDDLRSQLSSMTSLSLDGALPQAKLKSLILDLIHNIAVLDDLLVQKVTRLSDWSWFRQLRYYLKQGVAPEQRPCSVRMLECEQFYSFEYQGNAPKLVHTPLTDKCYLTLMHGLHLGYGGNPYGPAGTGKTESVKALGSCLGRQVLVFNCDEGIDFQAMGRIFVGLVRCGAWGCFDEFNRLLEEQMSAISQSVQLIQAAIKNSHSTVHLLQRDVQVNHNAGIFITLNPATKGYGGRQKLPDNLKQLFRPVVLSVDAVAVGVTGIATLTREVAMSVPDNELIAEVMMFAEGFASAKVLAQKIVSLFLLSRQLLSSQQHYDWGLRALKPILTLAGRLLQEIKAAQSEPLREDEEAVLLLKAVRMNTLSKLTFADSRRFQDLCMDLFPGINVKDIEYQELEAVIRETIREMRLAEIDSQIYKMLQFHEACQQRMGVGIVGPSGCGKSTIWKVLEAAYKKQGKRYVLHVMNPKSMHRVRLLGHMDHDTREWFDGVLTASARKVIKEPSTTHNWIVCDGDIDPEWVESLNSVLDDNRLLTMPNGERIQFGTNVNFVFETDHLRFASPATISRLTIIFLSEEDVDVKPLVTSWILKQPEDQQARLESWFDELFYRALDWLYKGNHELAIETTRMGMVSNVLGHLSQEGDAEGPGLTKQNFLLAICRGLGGNVSEEDRAMLTREAFKWANENIPDPSQPLHCQVVESLIVGYQQMSTAAEISLEDVQRSSILPPLVPTATVLRNMDLFATWLAHEQPFIVSGPEGSGKNLLIRHAIQRLQNESDTALNVAVLNCNAQTTSKDVLQKLRQFCSISTGTTGRIYRPREGRRLVLYLKDINLPTPDKYDTSEIIMFLQQAVMHKGFYDDDLEFVQLEHIQIVASIAPASTLGRHRLATRFTAIVRVCSISYPSSEELTEVYTHFLRAIMTAPHWQNVADRAYAVCDKAAEAMVDVYTNMKAKFTMDDHEHYLFNPRDLTQWVLQLLRYEVVSIDSFIEAWAYEATRIFRDRLVGDEAKNHFDAILRNALIQYLGTDVDVDKLIFTSMLTLSDEGVPSGDMKKVALEDYTKMVQDGLKSYQREVKDLDVELVPEVLEQIKWMDRALAALVANDLLVVGRSGGGKRSAISLLAHMHRLAVFSPAPACRYGHKEWKRDLKQVMQMTGVEKQHTILLLEDHHLLKSEFLESINSLLSAGDVPGIWTPEELEPLLAPLKEEWAASQGRGGGARTPFEYFCTQVQQRLHVVLSMDPNHSHFLPYCAANPALFSCTTVLWLDEWCDHSKTIIAQRILGEEVLDSKRTNLGPLLQYIHASQAAKGACPRHFITLLQTCHAMYSSKISSASGQSSHLQKGLLKLQEVSQTVEQLQEDAIAKQAVLAEKQQLADEALERITQAMKKSAERRQEVEQLEGLTKEEQDKTAEEKAQIEKELSEIQPILDAAKKAVGSIKPEHLNEIRALKMPPDPIHDVLNGVLRIMGNYDNSWASMKKFLAGTGAIQRIINFDPRSIDNQTRHDVEKLLREKANSFEHATIYRVSVAAAPLAKWVVASVRYSTVLVKVSPMEEKLNRALESFRAAQEKLSLYKED